MYLFVHKRSLEFCVLVSARARQIWWRSLSFYAPAAFSHSCHKHDKYIYKAMSIEEGYPKCVTGKKECIVEEEEKSIKPGLPDVVTQPSRSEKRETQTFCHTKHENI